jgi:hypothetical protein
MEAVVVVALRRSASSLLSWQSLTLYVGTPTKNKLGANAILGVSMAVAKAAAAEKVCTSIALEANDASARNSRDNPRATPVSLTEAILTLSPGRPTLRPHLRPRWHQEALRSSRTLHERSQRWVPRRWCSRVPGVHDCSNVCRPVPLYEMLLIRLK